MGDAAPGCEQVIRMLRADHEQIKGLLTTLMCASERGEQERVMSELFLNLRIHSICEQKVFYPSLVRLVDAKRIAEFGKDLYYLLSLMLELESTSAHYAPFDDTLVTLTDRFEQHVKKDENLFHSFDESFEESKQLSLIAEEMDACRGELQKKFDCARSRGAESRFGAPQTRCA